METSAKYNTNRSTLRHPITQTIAGILTAIAVFIVMVFSEAHAQQFHPTANNFTTIKINTIRIDSNVDKKIALKNHLEIWSASNPPEKKSQWIEHSEYWQPYNDQKKFLNKNFLRLKIFNDSNADVRYMITHEGMSPDTLSASNIEDHIFNSTPFFKSRANIINPGYKLNNRSFLLPAQKNTTIGLYFNGNKENLNSLKLREIEDYKTIYSQQKNIWFFISGIALSTLIAVTLIPFAVSTLVRSNIMAFTFVYGATSCGLISLPAYYLYLNDVSPNTFIQNSALLQMIALIGYAWIVNLSLSLHYKIKRYPIFFLIALCILFAGLSVTIPTSTFITLTNLFSILVTFGLCIYTISLHIKNPSSLVVLALTILKSVLLLFLIQLEYYYSINHLNFHNYYAIQSSIIWFEILCVLLLIKASLQSNFNHKRNLALSIVKQEQKIASITSFVKASRHNLRAPLSDIIGLSELISDHPLDQHQRKFILDIQRVARNALDNINSLFSYSQLNNIDKEKNNTIASEPFDLNNLVSECTQYYSSHIAEKNKELILDMTEYNSDYLIGDHEKIRQLFMHIIEYCIVISDAKDLYIKITLADNKNLSIKFICEPLKLIHSEKEYLPPVLQLSNLLTQQMQGDFHIDNLQGYLNIKVAIQDSGQNTNFAKSIEKLIGKRVLVFDDNLTSCEIICSYLNRWQVNATYATNNIEAAAILRHHNSIDDPFDLLVIDYLLPEKNGIEFVIQIKQDPLITHSLAILMMSNASHMIDQRQARNCGINHILEKPVIAETLKLALLEEFLLNDSVKEGLDGDYKKNSPGDFESLPHHQKIQRFLLVEDNSISAKITGAHLKELNIEYDLISTGEAAIQYISKNEYSAILLDCQLPDQSGLEVTKRIRDLEKSKRGSRKKLTIVALTAENSESYKQQCLNAGMDIFITKPINKRHIQSLLESL